MVSRAGQLRCLKFEQDDRSEIESKSEQTTEMEVKVKWNRIDGTPQVGMVSRAGQLRCLKLKFESGSKKYRKKMKAKVMVNKQENQQTPQEW